MSVGSLSWEGEASRPEVERRLSDGESARSIAIDFGIRAQTLGYHLRKWGHAPDAARSASALKREKSTNWKGGTFIDRYGYRMVRTDKGRLNPYVPEHVLIVEAATGQPIPLGMVVHHINGIKLDNRLENLVVLTRAEHRRLHAQLEALAFELLREGALTFNGTDYVRTGAP